MDSIPPPLESILLEIQRGLDAKLFYAAIAVALSIPDICAWLSNDPDPAKLWDNRKRQAKNYKAWFEENLAARFNHLTSEDCYSMRCGVLHQGQFGRPDDRYDRIIFLAPQLSGRGQVRCIRDVVVPISPGISFGGVTGKVLQLEAIWFCEQIIAAAREWAVAKAADPIIRKNLPNLVRYRSEGLPPYIVGQPLIA